MSWLIKKMKGVLLGNVPKILGNVPKMAMVAGIVLLVYLVSFTQLCRAGMGLETNPGQIDVTGVPLGRRVAVSKLSEQPVYLEIKNKSDVAYYYAINILYTSQTTSPLREGFVDIPDTSWIIPEEKEVRVEANQTKEVELYINIPNKKAFANKKYQAVIEVKSKKNNPQEVFVLATQLKMLFSTQAAEGEQEREYYPRPENR